MRLDKLFDGLLDKLEKALHIDGIVEQLQAFNHPSEAQNGNDKMTSAQTKTSKMQLVKFYTCH